MSKIQLTGVKQNNLKNIDVEIPLGSFTVVCGPSGSGKSSLAFETLYAEGQRRYIESLSNYTKQFLNKAPKPDVEDVQNIPPALALEQKNSVKSSRSTVGTQTELVDYLRVLYEKLGKAYCPTHHLELKKHSPDSACDETLNLFEGKRGYILAPILAEERVLEGKALLKHLIQEGFLRIYVPKKVKKATKKKTNKKKVAKKRSTTKSVLKSKEEIIPFSIVEMGDILDLNDPKVLKKGLPKVDFYLVIDRLAFKPSEEGRIIDSLRQAYSVSLKLNDIVGGARCHLLTTEGEQIIFSEAFSCSVCDHKFPEISTQLFNFSSPIGACETCKGFGNILTIDEQKIIPDPTLTIAQGAIKPYAMPSARREKKKLMDFCGKAKIDVHEPWVNLSKKQQDSIWKGNKTFSGIEGFFEKLEQKKYKMHVRVFLARHKRPTTCPTCKGSKLKPEAEQVLIEKLSITDMCKLSFEELNKTIGKIKLTKNESSIVKEPLQQLKARLSFLLEVGVSYLTLDRLTKTLSGGEFQRIALSNQLGTGLSQTLYVLDEPTIGLHPRDNEKLIGVLQKLNELDNTLVVVEHDEEVIKSSSHIIEMGPGSGYLGGEVLFSGEKESFYLDETSITAPYVKPNKAWIPPYNPKPVDIDKYRYKLHMHDCTGNNLKDIDVSIPLNRIVTVTGVSGSGKSTLISKTLYPHLAALVKKEFISAYELHSISGDEHVKNVLMVDQTSIGKTARSNPVTYLKVFDAIRTLFAGLPESKQLGYLPGTFSLNVEGGRCPVCKGLGFELIDMMFMDDIEVPCDACSGRRYRDEILELKFKGKSVVDVLNMTVDQAMDFFISFPNIRKPLSILKEVGLEYLTLGQSANSLSGGESQRLKLAKEISGTDQRGTLYILDEPTTGLHFREIQLLMKVLHKLIDAGGSVILIEHNLDVITNSDYIIDIGPEAGKKGGQIVATGTPEEVSRIKKSLTGKFLKPFYSQTKS